MFHWLVKSGDSWMYPGPNVPRHGKSRTVSPIFWWVFMGLFIPKNPYHGYTVTGTPNCPLIKATEFLHRDRPKRRLKFPQPPLLLPIVLQHCRPQKKITEKVNKTWEEKKTKHQLVGDFKPTYYIWRTEKCIEVESSCCRSTFFQHLPTSWIEKTYA